MNKKSVAQTEQEITIPAISIAQVTFHIVGDSPLIMHAWSEKAKAMMLGKQTKKATNGKEIRNPVREFVDSMYWLTEKPCPSICDEEHHDELTEFIAKSQFGFPATAFKAAAVDGGFRSGAIPNKVSAFSAFHINQDMIPITGTPIMREDMVRLGGISRAADLRYRGEFDDWGAIITCTYNANAISAEQLANLFNLGGFACGLGEWRVEKGGEFGMFHIV